MSFVTKILQFLTLFLREFTNVYNSHLFKITHARSRVNWQPVTASSVSDSYDQFSSGYSQPETDHSTASEFWLTHIFCGTSQIGNFDSRNSYHPACKIKFKSNLLSQKTCFISSDSLYHFTTLKYRNVLYWIVRWDEPYLQSLKDNLACCKKK